MFLLDMGYRRKSCRDVSLHYHGAMVSGNEEGSYTETRQHRSFFFFSNPGTAIHRANTLDYGGSLLFQVRLTHTSFLLFCFTPCRL